MGAVAGWLLAIARAGARFAVKDAELRARLVAAESTAGGLRDLLAEHAATIRELRESLEYEQHQRIESQTRLTETLSNLEQQRKLLADAETRFRETFEALSHKALRANSAEFSRQADEKIKPLTDAIKAYEQHVREIEQTRRTAYGKLSEQLKSVATTSQELTRQTTTLSTALRSPEIKGNWGELTLRNAVELAGLSKHCDFSEQKTVDSADGKLRPDLLVRLPGGRLIVVDAKAPTSAYMDAIAADTPDAARAAQKRHAQAMRQHMRGLAAKSYAEQFERSPEFVVMFVPGESFFAAALEADKDLIADGIRKGVILASPTTLIALLRTVSHAWQQQDILDNARRIGQTAGELFERMCKFAEHFGGIGERLGKATDAYNAAIGSWQSRVLPAGRRVQELGMRSKDAEQLDLKPVEALPRGDVETEGAPRASASSD
jgi:DNA recombination protein RmuC